MNTATANMNTETVNTADKASLNNTVTTTTEFTQMDTKVTALVMSDINHILGTIQSMAFEQRLQLIKVAQAQLEVRSTELTTIAKLRASVTAAQLENLVEHDALLCLNHHTLLDTITMESIKTVCKPVSAESRILANGIIHAKANDIRLTLGIQDTTRPWYKRWFGL